MITQQSRIPYLPARIEGLAAIAMNLWWSWSREARALFHSIDEALWHRTRHNPLELLCRVDPARIAACASDSDFLRRYDDVMERMAHEANTGDTWFAAQLPRPQRPAGGLLLRRVRPAQFGADLLGRPGRAGRRPLQVGQRPRCAAGGRGSLLPEGLLRPAAESRGMAGRQRRGVRRQRHAAGSGGRTQPPALAHHGRDVRASGPRTRLADDGRSGTDLSPRHQPGRQSPGRPRL